MTNAARTTEEWTCMACDATQRGMRFEAQSHRSLPEINTFECGECARCASVTLLDKVDPSPWYLNGYERHRLSHDPLAVSRRNETVGKVASLAGRIGARPGAWVPPHPKWAAQFRGTSVGFDSPILDVGCGQGNHLRHLATFGFTRLHGIDPYLAEPSVDLGAVRLERRGIEDIDDTYSAILFNHSLEHVDDPVVRLAQARALLRPGGVIIVDLPIVGGRAWERFRDNWIGIDVPLHRYVPSPDGMARLAERAGLEVVRWQGSTTPYFYLNSLMIQVGASPMTHPVDEILSERTRAWATRTARREHGTAGSQASFVLAPG